MRTPTLEGREDIDRVVCEITRAHPKCHVVFRTMRDVGMRHPGPVELSPCGLHIDVLRDGRLHSLPVSLSLQGDPVIVQYVRQNGWHTDTEAIRAMHMQFPRAPILAVMCTCNHSGKAAALEELKREGIVLAIIEGEDCGGQITNERILQGFIRNWPHAA